MSKVEIIIDHRERQIIPFIEKTERHGIDYTTNQLSIGDYLICLKEDHRRVLAVVERKTWKDLAASFYDGRKANIQKLLQLREVSDCKIIYLLEGNPFRRADEKIQRMPFKNLQAHLDHLLFRDGVHVMYTRDGRGSMQRLFDFANNLTTFKNPSLSDICADIKAGEPAVDTTESAEVVPPEEASDDTKEIDTAEVDDTKEVNDDDVALLLTAAPPATNGGLELALSRKRTPISDATVVRNLIKHLPSIGPIGAETLLDNGITLKSLYDRRHSVDDIAKLKNGNIAIGVKRATKIVNGVSKLSDVATQVKMLAEIPQLSLKSAANIVARYSFSQLLGVVTSEELAAVMKTEKTKVGITLAETILRVLNFVI